jgi:hypothetical protein
VAKKYGLKYRTRMWEKLALKISPEVRGFVRSSVQIEPSHLKDAIARLKRPELHMKLAKETHEQGLSMREAKRRAATLECGRKGLSRGLSFLCCCFNNLKSAIIRVRWKLKCLPVR